jgi:aspartate-semialdehyde dehydrogenase
MSKKYHVAIVGATGAVGIELLRVMERRDFPVADLRLLASPRSAGKSLEFRGQDFSISSARAKFLCGYRPRLFQRWRRDGKAIRTHRAAGWSGGDR